MDIIKRIIDFEYRFKIKAKIFLPIVILIFMSLMLLKYSSIEKEYLFYSQLRWMFLGICSFYFFSYIRIDFIYKNSYQLYFFIIGLLFLTILFGIEVNHSRRWLSVGFINFQPSEFGKLFFVFFIAKVLAQRSVEKRFGIVLFIILCSFFVVFFIIQQPDLGTSLVYLFLIFPMMLWANIKLVDILLVVSPFVSFFISFIYEFSSKTNAIEVGETYFFILFSVWVIGITLILFIRYRNILNVYVSTLIVSVNLLITMLTKQFFQKLETSYWINRILAYLDPHMYRNNYAYQINSSYDAIGSGGLSGKGLGKGLLTEFKMMPIYESDFIVSALAEQYGLFGVVVLLTCLIYFFYWMIVYIDKCPNRFEQLIIVGFCSIWFFHSFVNLCIVSGMLPVTGLPFPFLSYGGTYLVTNFLMFSVANKIISSHVSN
ncbi:MAG: hypothetical protein CMG00_04615 [Candidatus Marinimicrobia bacterium]|mgnify:CR=1 FL=1|nr:hypothetical protein [Candidatus Neomarinimicrobiota bacterium]|tara:strand:- start:10968 stop:12257 length:1290 start_codon:yes stop_codon:yes gene_type:complete